MSDPDFQPSIVNPFGLTQVGVSWGSPTLADIDADGDLDAFVGNGEGGIESWGSKKNHLP